MRVESSARKILLVTNDLGPHAGGIESFILGLLGEMDGKDVVIFTSSQDGDAEFDRKLAAQHGVEVIRDRAKVLLPTPRVNRAVSAVMKRYQSEYIWFGAAMPLGWMSGHLKKRGARRIVTLTHGHEVWWSKVWPFSWILKRSARNIDAIGYLGDFTQRAIRKSVGPRVRMERIAPGISIDHFRPGAKSDEIINSLNLSGKSIIVCVGRLVHRKGQDKLIEAMPEILRTVPNAHLLLVGEGPYKDYLTKLVSKFEIQASVTFVGRLNYAQLPTYIQLGDVFAMPSRSRFFGLEVEGLGIVYLEASSCGVPVIAGASGGAPDAVLQGETGIVVDGNSPSSIAKGVSELLLNPSKRLAMSQRGREWAEQEWSWKIWGKKFNELLLGE